MTIQQTLTTIAALLMLMPAISDDRSASSDLAAEWRQSAELDGEVVDLRAADRGFVGLFHPHMTAKRVGAVILLHGPGTHADSDEVVGPLRRQLADHGWETLSVQLPTPYRHENVADWKSADEPLRARLAAAVAWFEGREQRRMAVIAVGASANPALRAIAAADVEDVTALVMISTPDDFAAEADRSALDDIARPMLDIFAEHDLPAVTATAAARRLAARDRADAGYQQYRVPGADAGFRAVTPLLVTRVRAWLNRHVGDGEID